jgi:hypothetical protein
LETQVPKDLLEQELQEPLDQLDLQEPKDLLAQELVELLESKETLDHRD